MKAKTLALTAIICGASFFGLNLTTAYAAAFDTVTKIENNIQTEQLSQRVRDRNRAIGAVLGIAAIVAISEHNKDRDRGSSHRRGGYNRGNSRHEAPPPPPMRHRR